MSGRSAARIEKLVLEHGWKNKTKFKTEIATADVLNFVSGPTYVQCTYTSDQRQRWYYTSRVHLQLQVYRGPYPNRGHVFNGPIKSRNHTRGLHFDNTTEKMFPVPVTGLSARFAIQVTGWSIADSENFTKRIILIAATRSRTRRKDIILYF